MVKTSALATEAADTAFLVSYSGKGAVGLVSTSLSASLSSAMRAAILICGFAAVFSARSISIRTAGAGVVI